jgi:transcriptional regulator with XRE-family HTH domain
MKDRPQDLSPISRQQWQIFGTLLRDRRNAAKLSRVALAHRAKVSDATIKFVETARHPPSRATLIRLLSVAELHLTWAEVPGQHEPPAQKQDMPAQSTPPAPNEPAPDPARFLMNLIGFDEIHLPPGAPKRLRIFQERSQECAGACDGQAGGHSTKDAPENE